MEMNLCRNVVYQMLYLFVSRPSSMIFDFKTIRYFDERVHKTSFEFVLRYYGNYPRNSVPQFCNFTQVNADGDRLEE